MEERQKALREWIALSQEARKVEDELLNIPRLAAEKSGVDADMVFTIDNMPKLMELDEKLKSLEVKRDEAYRRFLDTLRQNTGQGVMHDSLCVSDYIVGIIGGEE